MTLISGDINMSSIKHKRPFRVTLLCFSDSSVRLNKAVFFFLLSTNQNWSLHFIFLRLGLGLIVKDSLVHVFPKKKVCLLSSKLNNLLSFWNDFQFWFYITTSSSFSTLSTCTCHTQATFHNSMWIKSGHVPIVFYLCILPVFEYLEYLFFSFSFNKLYLF